jgi:hypothetical protein
MVAKHFDPVMFLPHTLSLVVPQAAAYSGAADEDLTADRIAAQDAQLAVLLKEREEAAK